MVGPRELPNAVALNAGLFNGSRVIGPAIAGVVIAAAGTGVCFVLNAISFLAVLAALALLARRRAAPGRARSVGSRRRGPAPRFAFVRTIRSSDALLGVVTVVEHWSASTSTCSCRCSPPTRSTSARRVRAALGGVRAGRPRRRSRDRVASARELATLRDRRRGLRRARARCSRPSERRPRRSAPVRSRHLLHALHRQRERARPARARPTTCAAG